MNRKWVVATHDYGAVRLFLTEPEARAWIAKAGVGEFYLARVTSAFERPPGPLTERIVVEE